MGRMPVPHRPKPFNAWRCPLASAWSITRRFHRLSPSAGLVAYALRTRAPLSEVPKDSLPFDLHVLGLPLAFILSQDQTLHCIIVVLNLISVRAPLCSLVPYSRNGPASRLTVSDFMLASSFQRTFPNLLSNCLPPSLFGTAKIHQKTIRASIF